MSNGHTLVVPKLHLASFFGLPRDDQADIWRLVAEVRSTLLSELQPDGFNIGMNDGKTAGQTVEHAHIHVIPRFRGDVDDPRGGVRWVLPARARYWE